MTATQVQPGWKAALAYLYEGRARPARLFRYSLVVFDIATIGYLVLSSFFFGATPIEVLDAVIGLVICADFAARLAPSPHRLRDLVRPAGLADIAVILSLLTPIAGEGLAFLRVVRALRLIRSYRLLAALRHESVFFRKHEDVALASLRLFVFVFVMTAIVYETQHRTNPAIANYTDALYFTVTTLTTTGFGDVTLSGPGGRLLSVVIMIFGVSLFLHLVRTLFRPARILHPCPTCGLKRHEPDAVHCRHCGTVLCIPNEGLAD